VRKGGDSRHQSVAVKRSVHVFVTCISGAAHKCAAYRHNCALAYEHKRAANGGINQS
jgi:hypothetical protein